MIQNSYLQEVLQHVNSLPGIVPAQRKASKQSYSFSNRSFAEQLAVWNTIWQKTNSFWVRVHAFFFLERNIKNEEALKQMWPLIIKWQDFVDDWGLCDALAKIYTNILVVLPDEVYGQLKKWNNDDNLWKRRQSVVSLLYYSRTKKKHPSFEKIIKLVNPLLGDREYYVQKGVGWTLRELYNVYPGKALLYFKKNIKAISSIAFTIAIEKLDTAGKNKLKMLRRVK
jgi:3-methyladenine DNA glycosylase AlkD